MSCSEAVTCKGPYSISEKYIRYNSEQHFEYLNNKYGGYLIDGFPFIWDLNFIEVHNCIITSSFIVERELIKSIGYMPAIPMGAGKASEDYVCWLDLFRRGEKCVYLSEPFMFYDEGHGGRS
jgi:hypothetical protein